jgi:hypothetical protein
MLMLSFFADLVMQTDEDRRAFENHPVLMDAVAHESLQPLRHFLYEHMQEEAGHETWVLNDLDAVGVTNSDAKAYAPSVHALALAGYNYWSAERRHPCSALGMLYALEVISSVYGGPFASAIRESLLLDGDRGVSFIASHASIDAQHMAELRLVLNQVADGAARQAVVESTRVNFHHFTRIVEAV